MERAGARLAAGTALGPARTAGSSAPAFHYFALFRPPRTIPWKFVIIAFPRTHPFLHFFFLSSCCGQHREGATPACRPPRRGPGSSLAAAPGPVAQTGPATCLAAVSCAPNFPALRAPALLPTAPSLPRCLLFLLLPPHSPSRYFPFHPFTAENGTSQQRGRLPAAEPRSRPRAAPAAAAPHSGPARLGPARLAAAAAP